MHGIRGVSIYRTIWISDTHLGTRGCKAEFLLDFLKYTRSEKLYLVGDIVDGWRLKRSWFWPQTHNDVLQKLLRKARKGTKVIYVPGNHDEAARQFAGLQFGGIDVVRECIHETADGKKYLVTHGDDFDVVVRYAKWLALLGDWAYTLLLWINHHFNSVRRLLGFPYWSLSAYLKHKVKRAVNYIGEFEQALSQEARRNGAQGVICGHIHHAAIRQLGDVVYINTGDWVESCTAVAETRDGVFEVIRWNPHPRRHANDPASEEFEAAA
jgi:UDP-2,3-diacylglucosamine pyrophosphatase LpxH